MSCRMIINHHVIFLTFLLFSYSRSLQSGFTCDSSVKLTCPEDRKILILEVTYSSECPSLTDGANDAPAHCIGYYRERASTVCNGQQICIFNHSLEHRPSFAVGQQANCAFKGQSINIDYSCVPDFHSSKLPRIDICSLQSLQGITEGFIHTPNYPNDYPNSRVCSKTVPPPDVGHRLKIYALDFDIEDFSILRFLGIKRRNDWFQINNSGEKMCGSLSPNVLLFDDIIEASLMFKSDFANTKRRYRGFVLYFIVTPVRAFRSSTTTTTEKLTSIKSETKETLSSQKDYSKESSKSKLSSLVSNDRQRQDHVALTLLVVILSGTLFVGFCAFILYKRRNDRRIRYLTDMFNSFFPARPKTAALNTTENNDQASLNNTVLSKLDLPSTSNDDKYAKLNEYDDSLVETPKPKHVNINEKLENLEKQVFIENLKTCPSPYVSYRRADNKFHDKDQINTETKKTNSNVYSEDPLDGVKTINNTDDTSLHYEYIDLNQKEEQKETVQPEQEDALYDIIDPRNERPVHPDVDADSVMYATPRDV